MGMRGMESSWMMLIVETFEGGRVVEAEVEESEEAAESEARFLGGI